MARHPRLARPSRHFRDELAREALRVEPAFAGDDRTSGAHARVESDLVQHVAGAGDELGPESGPQSTREPAGSARHRHAARVPWQRTGESMEALREPPNIIGRGALLWPVHLRRVL